MELRVEDIVRLVPREFPALGPYESFSTKEIYSPEDGAVTTDLLVSSYLWSQAIQRSWLSRSSLLRHLPASQFAAGFVYVPQSQREAVFSRFPFSNNFVFGAQVLVRPQSDVEGSREVATIEVDGMRFPIVVLNGQASLHGTPPHPNQSGANWRSTCWARNRSKSPTWSDGILTCRHGFTNPQLGSSVTLASSSDHSQPVVAQLADFDNSSIDAAVLEIPASSWPNLSQLRVTSATAPGRRVSFETPSGTVAGRVLRTFLSPTYFGNMFGQRIITDVSGVPGDSGALLIQMKSNEGIGIYMGSIPDGSGGTEGLFQSLEQAAVYFDLDLYL